MITQTTNTHQTHIKHAALCGLVMTGILLLSGISAMPRFTAPADAAGRRTVAASLTAETLSGAVRLRNTLLSRSTIVDFVAGSGKTVGSFTVALADHPAWVGFLDDDGSLRVTVRGERIHQELLSHPVTGLASTSSCSILRQWKDAAGVDRIETDCIAETGYEYDAGEVAELIKLSLESGTDRVSFPVTSVAPQILGSEQSGSLVTTSLSLLARGQSNFEGSGVGRKSNVRKALNERVHNVIVPQGSTFSFNSLLGKVTLGNGWSMALTIFNGKDLVAFPGGGICQASTTLYRGLLKAGFPIVAHKSHSLYVHYYEQYGVGLDATVFPGKQDLVFVNDTPGPLVLQSYNRGDEATVNIFGIDDHRTVTLSGPYFASTAPADLQMNGHAVRKNEVAWKRSIVTAAGAEMQEVFSARYNAIPRSIPAKYAATTEQSRGDGTTHEVVAAR